MEEVLMRFSHLGQDIFDSLNNENLIKCRKINKSWKIFIDNEKFSSKRIIKSFFKKSTKNFEITLKGATSQDAKCMANNIKTCYKIWATPMSELHYVAFWGRNKELLEKIFDTSDVENPDFPVDNKLSLLDLAAGNGYLRICKFIQEYDQTINFMAGLSYPTGTTPFNIAAQKGNHEICKLIVKNGWNLQPMDINGQTPLHLAFGY